MKKRLILLFAIIIVALGACSKMNDWQKAMKFYDRGKYKKAIKYFKKESEKVIGRRDQCYYQIGKSYFKLRKYDEAKKYFAYIAKPKDSKEIVKIYMDAMWQFNGGKFQIAYDDLNKIIQLTPTYRGGQAYYYYLRAIYHVKGLKAALDESKYALTVIKDHLSQKQIGNLYNLYAKFLVEAKQYKEAIIYLKKSLEIDDDFYTHYNLGLAYESLKDYGDAKTHFFQSYMLGKFDDAKWKYFKYCNLDEVKDNLDIFKLDATAFKYFRKGVDFFNKGQFEYFRYWVQKALNVGPRIERLFYQWGTYQMIFNKNELYKANVLHYVLGKGTLAREKYEALKTSYDRDLNYGILLLKAGRLDEALKILNGLAAGKFNDRKYFYIGLLYLNEGKTQEAIDNFKLAAKDNSKVVSLAYFQGILSEMKKNKFKEQDKILHFLNNNGDKEVKKWIEKNLNH